MVRLELATLSAVGELQFLEGSKLGGQYILGHGLVVFEPLNLSQSRLHLAEVAFLLEALPELAHGGEIALAKIVPVLGSFLDAPAH